VSAECCCSRTSVINNTRGEHENNVQDKKTPSKCPSSFWNQSTVYGSNLRFMSRIHKSHLVAGTLIELESGVIHTVTPNFSKGTPKNGYKSGIHASYTLIQNHIKKMILDKTDSQNERVRRKEIIHKITFPMCAEHGDDCPECTEPRSTLKEAEQACIHEHERIEFTRLNGKKFIRTYDGQVYVASDYLRCVNSENEFHGIPDPICSWRNGDLSFLSTQI
jgi:CRISPR/Cas system CMR-associated protein Cmr5 small subunit